MLPFDVIPREITFFTSHGIVGHHWLIRIDVMSASELLQILLRNGRRTRW
jgi:hypothetical protein